MIKKLIIFTTLLFLIASFSDCTLKKRSYRDGYYVSWNKKSVKSSKPIASKHEKIEENKVSVLEEKKELTNEAQLIASTDNSNAPIDIANNKPIAIVSDSCGDLIIMRNAEQITAKVIELSETTIKYKPCSNLNGPLIVVSIDKVYMIKYVNGTKDVFEIKPKVNENRQINQQKLQVDKKNNPLAVGSFVSGFFFIFIFPGIASIIMGVIALVQFKNNPEKYKNKWMAKFWIVFFAILTVLYILLALLMGI